MKLKIQVALSSQPKLNEIINEFNQWQYRLNDIKLVNNLLEIDLGNLPVFWEQFLAHVPSLKKELKPLLIDAMRQIPEEKIGVAFNKAMAILSQT